MMNQKGRSMIEMLGVLAIIGVLSVSGLAGYNKAMLKYKLNKHAEQMSFLINAIHTYQYEFRFETKDSLSLISLYKKINAIPEGMTIVESKDSFAFLKDSFGTYSTIYINHAPYNNQTKLGIYGGPGHEAPINFSSSDVGIAYCLNILSVLQPIYKKIPKVLVLFICVIDRGWEALI